MKDALRLVRDVIIKPEAAIESLTSGRRGFAGPLLAFSLYALAAAALSPFLPADFLQTGAQPRSFWFTLPAGLTAALIGGVAGTGLILFFNHWFRNGRPAFRVPAAILASAVYFFAVFLSEKGPLAMRIALPALPLLAAAAGILADRALFVKIFKTALAANAAPLALFPLEAAAAALPSKGLFEAATITAAFWTLWLLVKGLRLSTGQGAARCAMSAFFGAMVAGILIFSLGFLFSKDFLAAALLF